MPLSPAARRIRKLLRETRLPVSSVAYYCRVNRKRLNSFLSGDRLVSDRQIAAVLRFLNRELETRAQSDQHRSEFDAIWHNLAERSLRYAVLERRNCREGTGVFVRIGNQEFIATCGHVLKEDLCPTAMPQQVLLARKGITRVEEAGKSVLRVNVNGEMDVGYIAIVPGTSESLGHQAIEIDRICNFGRGQPGRNSFLWGYPDWSEAPHNHRMSKSGNVDLQPINYAFPLLAADEWGDLEDSRFPFKKSRDIVFRYDRHEDLKCGDGTLPNPKGMSGCGLWQGITRIGPNDLWVAEDIKLIGIQCGVGRPDSPPFARCVQIHHWLSLVANDFPSLRRAIGKVKTVSSPP
ncbi:hypothetical protein [Anatilimnocola aggregata]|nr:hypothetical protein [Anatilimnocola aggregata]